MSIGILKWECVVLPLDNIDAAIPDVAVAKAEYPFDLTFARSAVYKNIFSVPPGPSIKKHHLCLCIFYHI